MSLRSFVKDAAVLSLALIIVFAAMSFFDPAPAFAHCDGLDGPVVNAARLALQTADVNRVLIWVPPADAGQIKQAFEEALAVRKLGPQAQALADFHFFETLVRVHRAGEGASYTGLKPAGRDLGPAIPAADKAIDTESDDALIELLTDRVGKGVRGHFKEVIEKKHFKSDDVAAGRDYVEAYVRYIHYVQRLYSAAEQPVEGLHTDTATTPGLSPHSKQGEKQPRVKVG